jgi:hypothetical protein
MPVKTTIDNAKGFYSTNNDSGIVLESNTANTGFSPYMTGLVRAITTTVTLSAGEAGNMTISGSSALTVVMADPANNNGAHLTFRNTSAHFHILSGSGVMFANNTSTGAQLMLSNSVGSSVSLRSDGATYLVLGNRNTITIS